MKKVLTITLLVLISINLFSGIFDNNLIEKANDAKIEGDFEKSYRYYIKAIEDEDLKTYEKSEAYNDLIEIYNLVMNNLNIKIHQRGTSASYSHNDIENYDIFDLDLEKTLLDLANLDINSHSSIESYLYLGEYYYLKNDFSKSIDYLEKYLDYDEITKESIAYLYIIYNNLKMSNFENAMNIYENNKDVFYDKKPILLEIYFHSGEYEEALELLETINKDKLYSININKSLIESVKENEFNRGNLQGHISYNKKPIENIKIWAIPFHENGYINNYDYHINGLEVDNYRFYAHTDKNGFFSFNNLPGGYYTYFVEFNAKQSSKYFKNAFVEKSDEDIVIDGNTIKNYDIKIKNTFDIDRIKVDKENNVYLKWEDVENASYYKITLGEKIIKENGQSESQFQLYNNEKIEDTKYTINVEEFYKSNFGSLTYGSDENIETESLVPYTWIENPFLVVNAYNEKDEIINSSYPLSTIVFDKSSGNTSFNISEEHRKIRNLLDNKNYDEAVAEAEIHLEENPNDIETIIFLAKIHKYGTSAIDENNSIKSSKKSNYYFSLLFELTNDPIYKNYIH
ncbi:MAG: hypothetical protein ACQESN_08215 [Thermotogota bacterium]